MNKRRFGGSVRVTGLVLICLALSEAAALAGAVDNNNTFSATFVRMLNRNAATDAADIAVYNPAGVAFLRDGLYFSFQNHMLFKQVAQTALDDPGQRTFLAENPSLLLPAGYLVYKRGRYGIFGSFTFPGGGGLLDYKQGIPATARLGAAAVQGYSVYSGFTLGGAIEWNDRISLAAGLRGILVHNWSKMTIVGENLLQAPVGTLLIEEKERGQGLSGFLGIHLRPTKNLDLALRYDHQVALSLQVFSNQAIGPMQQMNPYLPEGKIYRRDLPGVLGFGVAYKLLPSLRLESSASVYLNRLATWEGSRAGAIVRGLQAKHNTGWDTGLGLEWSIKEYVGLSAGFLYTETGADTDSLQDVKPALDNLLLGGGFFLRLFDNTQLDFSMAHITYFDAIMTTETGTRLKLSKDGFVLAMGLQFRAL